MSPVKVMLVNNEVTLDTFSYPITHHTAVVVNFVGFVHGYGLASSLTVSLLRRPAPGNENLPFMAERIQLTQNNP